MPFSDYGENAIITVQNAIVILLIYAYDKSISMVEKLVVIVAFSGYTTFLLMDQDVPEHAWPMIASSCIILNCMARIPQIYSNFKSKSTGVLAFVTFLLAWAGSGARTVGVCLQSDDIIYKMQFIISFTLNSIIIL